MTDPSCIGIVVCGGQSRRMGQDKSLMIYHELPQRYHLAAMLQSCCNKVLLSLNPVQEDNSAYPVLVDAAPYHYAGPAAALLTASAAFPGRDFLLLGCDYPLLDEQELHRFIKTLQQQTIAAAFYNEAAGLYEPLLAYYSAAAAHLLHAQYLEGQSSLQRLLHKVGADRYFPGHSDTIFSADNPDAARQARVLLAQRKKGGDLQ
ncbi:NTP transferase domain-containing protein [Taibaiella helva]|uniref:NTP transferase domain-containing protein n=1 Tax=Taibaiella helva TaxID=2301235 RepID=UPI000E585BC0|nr:NTP transferase domain-containing protein [Taibaiella helva]